MNTTPQIHPPLGKILGRFRTSVDVERLDFDFVSEIVRVSDPSGKGLAFDVGLDSDSNSVFLIIDKIPSRALTTAESFTSGELLAMVRSLLSGEVRIARKLFLWSVIEFVLDDGRKYRTLVWGRRNPIASYQRLLESRPTD